MPVSRLHKRIRIGLVLFWVTVVAWMLWNMQEHGVPNQVMQTSAEVTVTVSQSHIRFEPTVDTLGVGLIFYPGALVEPVAYAPLARAIAARGIPAIIVKIPFRLAPRDKDEQAVFEKTMSIIQADSRSWIVGGHSRGGALAALFAQAHGRDFSGLLLVGTSHPKSYSLSTISADVTKIFATNDGLASVEEVRGFSPNLPESTHFVEIAGGNHRQFGFYGWQLGDGRATISRTAQLDETVEAIIEQVQRVRDRDLKDSRVEGESDENG